jgi:hypothetical protein
MPDPLSTQMMFQAAGFFNRRSHSSAARSAASCVVRRLKIRFSRRRAAFRCWLTQALDDQIRQAREHVAPIAGELDGCRQQGRSNLDRGRKDHERLKVPSLNKRSGRWIGFLKALRTLSTPLTFALKLVPSIIEAARFRSESPSGPDPPDGIDAMRHGGNAPRPLTEMLRAGTEPPPACG